jgi:uncharacterized protein (DUF1697 family)
MPAFVALLRGVNVGKAKRVAMADVRRIVQDLACTDVTTLLNSGNVVFQHAKTPSAKVAAKLAGGLAAQLKFAVPVVVKSSAEFVAILNENPFARQVADPSRLLVAFTQEAKALTALSSLAPQASPTEQFVVGKHAAFLCSSGGIVHGKVGIALLGKAGQSATTRNWGTCLKLYALLKQ